MDSSDSARCEQRGTTASPQSPPEPSAARTLAELVRDRRAQLKLSLQGVADRGGMTKAHLWEIEQGRAANPTIGLLCGLSTALNLLPSEVCAAAVQSSVSLSGSKATGPLDRTETPYEKQ